MKKFLLSTAILLCAGSSASALSSFEKNDVKQAVQVTKLAMVQLNLNVSESFHTGDFQSIARTSLEVELYTGAGSALSSTIKTYRY